MCQWITNKKRDAIYRRDDYTCQYCNRVLTSTDLSLDHIKPRAKGGKNHASNLVTACLTCNCQKKDKTLRQYSAWLKSESESMKLRVNNARRRRLRYV